MLVVVLSRWCHSVRMRRRHSAPCPCTELRRFSRLRIGSITSDSTTWKRAHAPLATWPILDRFCIRNTLRFLTVLQSLSPRLDRSTLRRFLLHQGCLSLFVASSSTPECFPLMFSVVTTHHQSQFWLGREILGTVYCLESPGLWIESA